MGLIVEDGSGSNPAANSYISLENFEAWAAQRGITLPEEPEGCESLLLRAMDVLETFSYIGSRVETTQPLQWPRECAYIGNDLLPDDEIPKNIIRAQCEIAIAAQSVDLFPVVAANAKGDIASESVYGAVSRTYFQKQTPTYEPWIGALRGVLRGYVVSSGPVGFARVIRA